MPRTGDSEVLEYFKKIYDEKGLDKAISKSKPSKEEIDSTKGLYDIMPDGIFKDKNPVEVAHPETFVFSDAFDRANGIVGNTIENQTRTLNYLSSGPSAMLYRYDKVANDLTMDLIKIANYMDSIGQEELAALADDCSTSLVDSKKKALNKEAWVPIVAAGVGLAAAYLYGTYSMPSDQGVSIMIDKSISEIKDILNPSSSDPWYQRMWDWRMENANSKDNQYFQEFFKKLQALKIAFKQYDNLDWKNLGIDKSIKNMGPEELASVSSDSGIQSKIKDFNKTVEVYFKLSNEIYNEIDDAIDVINHMAQPKEARNSFMFGLKELSEYVVPSEYYQAKNYLQALKKSIGDSIKDFQKRQDKINSIGPKLEQKIEEGKKKIEDTKNVGNIKKGPEEEEEEGSGLQNSMEKNLGLEGL